MSVKKKKKKVEEKPLEKMTARELRELAIQIPEITGVHRMNKGELTGSIKRARGIEDELGGQTDSSVRETKQKIKEFKVKREAVLEIHDTKMATIYRRRISRLKKKTRKAA